MIKRKNTTLSIVVAAWNGEAALAKCLDSIKHQTDLEDVEVIVAANFPFIEIKLPIPATFVQFETQKTVPELRTAGIQLAAGAVVALIEDICFLDPGWAEKIKKAHDSEFSAVGGSVENAAVENTLDWAVYFYDYGKFMPPNSEGAIETLSGLNLSYKQNALAEVREHFSRGFYETFVNNALKKSGHKLAMSPEAIVYFNKEYGFNRAAGHCYFHARAFAARRCDRSDIIGRSFYTAASLALPIVLPVRIIRTTVQKGRHYKELIRSLPVLIFLIFFWSFGEFSGYLRGDGGSSRRWR